MIAEDVSVITRMRQKLKANFEHLISSCSNDLRSNPPQTSLKRKKYEIIKKGHSNSFTKNETALVQNPVRASFSFVKNQNERTTLATQVQKSPANRVEDRSSQNTVSFFQKIKKKQIFELRDQSNNRKTNGLELTEFLVSGHLDRPENKNNYYYFFKGTHYYQWILDQERFFRDPGKDVIVRKKPSEYMTISQANLVHTIDFKSVELQKENYLKEYRCFQNLRKLTYFKYFQEIKILKLWIFESKIRQFGSVCSEFNRNFIFNRPRLQKRIFSIGSILKMKDLSEAFNFAEKEKQTTEQIFQKLFSCVKTTCRSIMDELKYNFECEFHSFFNEAISENQSNKKENEKFLDQAADELKMLEIKKFMIADRTKFTNFKRFVQKKSIDVSLNLSHKQKILTPFFQNAKTIQENQKELVLFLKIGTLFVSNCRHKIVSKYFDQLVRFLLSGNAAERSSEDKFSIQFALVIENSEVTLSPNLSSFLEITKMAILNNCRYILQDINFFDETVLKKVREILSETQFIDCLSILRDVLANDADLLTNFEIHFVRECGRKYEDYFFEQFRPIDNFMSVLQVKMKDFSIFCQKVQNSTLNKFDSTFLKLLKNFIQNHKSFSSELYKSEFGFVFTRNDNVTDKVREMFDETMDFSQIYLNNYLKKQFKALFSFTNFIQESLLISITEFSCFVTFFNGFRVKYNKYLKSKSLIESIGNICVILESDTQTKNISEKLLDKLDETNHMFLQVDEKLANLKKRIRKSFNKFSLCFQKYIEEANQEIQLLRNQIRNIVCCASFEELKEASEVVRKLDFLRSVLFEKEQEKKLTKTAMRQISSKLTEKNASENLLNFRISDDGCLQSGMSPEIEFLIIIIDSYSKLKATWSQKLFSDFNAPFEINQIRHLEQKLKQTSGFCETQTTVRYLKVTFTWLELYLLISVQILANFWSPANDNLLHLTEIINKLTLFIHPSDFQSVSLQVVFEFLDLNKHLIFQALSFCPNSNLKTLKVKIRVLETQIQFKKETNLT